MNEAAGSTHAAAWALPDGAIEVVREDVGRHNALDKLIGAMRRSSTSTNEGLVLLSSRASYEMVKAACRHGDRCSGIGTHSLSHRSRKGSRNLSCRLRALGWLQYLFTPPAPTRFGSCTPSSRMTPDDACRASKDLRR